MKIQTTVGKASMILRGLAAASVSERQASLEYSMLVAVNKAAFEEKLKHAEKLRDALAQKCAERDGDGNIVRDKTNGGIVIGDRVVWADGLREIEETEIGIEFDPIPFSIVPNPIEPIIAVHIRPLLAIQAEAEIAIDKGVQSPGDAKG